jgi:hypothetical protein
MSNDATELAHLLIDLSARQIAEFLRFISETIVKCYITKRMNYERGYCQMGQTYYIYPHFFHIAKQFWLDHIAVKIDN